MTTTYHLATVYTNEAGLIATKQIGTFEDKSKAMNAAKRAAHTRSDCQLYGPNSICYVGKEITAVVSW